MKRPHCSHPGGELPVRVGEVGEGREAGPVRDQSATAAGVSCEARSWLSSVRAGLRAVVGVVGEAEGGGGGMDLENGESPLLEDP